MDTQIRHKLFGESPSTIIKNFYDYFLDENKGKRFPLSFTKYWNRTAVVERATKAIEHIDSSKFMKFARTKVGKGGLIAAGGIVAWNLVQSHVKNLFDPSPAIPRNFDRGYDQIKQSLTDFGSPVKLAKAANKIITPYKSSVRRSTIKTTKCVTENNLSLKMYKNAIKHHHY